jgi:hypothetical protein
MSFLSDRVLKISRSEEAIAETVEAIVAISKLSSSDVHEDDVMNLSRNKGSLLSHSKYYQASIGAVVLY